IFLENDRTLGRKLEEAFIAWQLEERLSKDQIIELYVNAVHWGPNVYGVGEASRAYFDKAPHQLTVRESAFLASILSNPDLFGREYVQGTIRDGRRVKMCNVLMNMRNSGFIDDGEYQGSCRAVNDGVVSDGSPTIDVHDRQTASLAQPHSAPSEVASVR
ncbi:MAG: transglycosylase domain-containing protein, partial [Myxococcales bacterium]|nr:transglycosylase domain-containing protein [Myxococcales bacterium]